MNDESHSLGVLRVAAYTAAAVGAAGSLAFMFRVGRSQKSIILVILFTGWVLLPFVALVWANFRSSANALALRNMCWLTFAIAAGSLVTYAFVALGPPRPKPASWFLMVPVYSWVIMIVLAAIVRGRTRSFSGR